MAKQTVAHPKEPSQQPAAVILPGEGIRDVRSELDRIIFFSDAVFAIAITLLALDIRFPDFNGNVSDTVLWAAVQDLLPRFGIYALSFVVIGVFWLSHHRGFRAINRYDLSLIWLNLVQLMFVAFLPVTSSMLSIFPPHQPTLILYSANVLLVAVMQFLTWRHAFQGHRLIYPNLDDRLYQFIRLNSSVSIVAFSLTIIVSFVNASVALAIPILVLLVYVPLARLFQSFLLRLLWPSRPSARAQHGK